MPEVTGAHHACAMAADADLSLAFEFTHSSRCGPCLDEYCNLAFGVADVVIIVG